MVYFCAENSENCQLLLPSYENLGRKLEDKINVDQTGATAVRFAKLDCTMESTLCNEFRITQYPFVIHYHRHVNVANWTSAAKSKIGLYPWLQGELGLGNRLRGDSTCSASSPADHVQQPAGASDDVNSR